MTNTVTTLKEPNWRNKDITYVKRCQRCDRENYAMAVVSGFCCWCGEDHNLYMLEAGK